MVSVAHSYLDWACCSLRFWFELNPYGPVQILMKGRISAQVWCSFQEDKVEEWVRKASSSAKQWEYEGRPEATCYLRHLYRLHPLRKGNGMPPKTVLLGLLGSSRSICWSWRLCTLLKTWQSLSKTLSTKLQGRPLLLRLELELSMLIAYIESLVACSQSLHGTVDMQDSN